METKIFTTKQGVMSVTDYYGNLIGLWVELEQNQNLLMEFSKDASTFVSFVERDRIFEFIYGLKPKCDPIRV